MEWIQQPSARSQPRLRAIVEVVDGELRIWPVADTDEEAVEVMDALRFLREDFADR